MHETHCSTGPSTACNSRWPILLSRTLIPSSHERFKSRARAPCGAARAPCCLGHWAKIAVVRYGQGTARTECPRAYDILSEFTLRDTRCFIRRDRAAPRGVTGSRAVHDLQARLDRILRVFATRRGSVDHVS